MHIMRTLCSTTAMLTIILACTGCETTVQVDLPPHESQLVVNGFFAPDSLWQVRLSNTVSFTDVTRLAVVDNAVVEVWANDQKLTTLASIGAGRYKSAFSPPSSTGRYTLKVQADGFEPIEGEGYLPEETAQASLEYRFISINEEQSEIKYSLILQDAPDRTNYYSLYALQRFVIRNNGELIDDQTFRWSIKTNDPVLTNSDFFDAEPSYFDQVVFDDNLFNGRTYELDFAIDYYSIGVDGPPEITYELSTNIVLLEMSEDMFTFWQTADRQRDAANDPFSEPVQVYSNMSNGFGIFAGYRVQVFPVTIDELN